MNIMKKILTPLTMCAVAVLSTSANASTLTLVGGASVTLGQSYTVDVLGDFNDTGLFDGGAEFGWDPAILSLDNIIIPEPFFDSGIGFGVGVVGNIDPTVSCPGNAACPPATTDAAVIRWGQFSENILEPNYGGFFNGPFGTSWTVPDELVMAQITFTAVGSGLVGISLGPDTFSGTTGVWQYEDPSTGLGPIPSPLYTGITAIPVPAAVWLFGSGLLGLVGVARRRKAA